MEGRIEVGRGKGLGRGLRVCFGVGVGEEGMGERGRRGIWVGWYRVVVLENDRVLVGGMREMFGYEGVGWRVCEKRGDVMEDVGRGSYEVLIRDLKMGGRKGLEVLKVVGMGNVGN